MGDPGRPATTGPTLKAHHAEAQRGLDPRVALPVTLEAGATPQRQVKAWRTKFFVFLEDRDVPPTNNGCEQALRPSVAFREITNGFRSHRGARIHAGYRSVVDTARLYAKTALPAVKIPLSGVFPPLLDAAEKP